MRTQLEQHPKEQRRANIAIAVACLAAIFAGWQAWEARQARADARTSSDAQKADVERSRQAAEASAVAAQNLASSGEQTATASEKAANAAVLSARSGEQSLLLTTRAIRLSNEPRLDAIDSKILKLITKDQIPSVMT
jgi:predicted negative regulator of RcsB-dependent stress response